MNELPRWVDIRGTMHTPLNTRQLSERQCTAVQHLAFRIASLAETYNQKRMPSATRGWLAVLTSEAADAILLTLLPTVSEEDIEQHDAVEKQLFIAQWLEAHEDLPLPPTNLAA